MSDIQNANQQKQMNVRVVSDNMVVLIRNPSHFHDSRAHYETTQTITIYRFWIPQVQLSAMR
jgi:N6-adenosine-specific RNA methylase IME4